MAYDIINIDVFVGDVEGKTMSADGATTFQKGTLTIALYIHDPLKVEESKEIFSQILTTFNFNLRNAKIALADE